jgi:hypothetical protein
MWGISWLGEELVASHLLGVSLVRSGFEVMAALSFRFLP